MRLCKRCGVLLSSERYWCNECRKLRKRRYAKIRYAEKGRRFSWGVCRICGKPYTKWESSRLCHQSCRSKLFFKSEHEKNKMQAGRYHARKIAKYLGIPLGRYKYCYAIHHIDGNTENNDPINLIALSHSAHTKLHKFLDRLLVEFVHNVRTGKIWVEKKYRRKWWKRKMVQVTERWLIKHDYQYFILDDFMPPD